MLVVSQSSKYWQLAETALLYSNFTTSYTALYLSPSFSGAPVPSFAHLPMPWSEERG